MQRILRAWLSTVLAALTTACLIPPAAAQNPPAVASADSRGPAITFLAPPEKSPEAVPPEADKDRRTELRQRWEALTPAERRAILETLRQHVRPELERAYAEQFYARSGSVEAPGFIARDDNGGGGGGDGEPPPGMTVTATALPATGPAPLTVTLQATAYDPEGPVLQFFWDFGDGQTGAGQWASHTYASAGSYWATVTAFGSGSSSGYAQALIQVMPGGGGGGGGGGGINLPPQVTLTATPDEGEQPLLVAASASASDPDGWITSYAWDFGDGGGSASPSTSHTYLAEGSYLARVTVTDDRGATAAAAVIIEVGSAIDSDGDGLPDSTERKLANHFMPGYFLSLFELPGTGMARFEDRPDEQVPSQVFPSLPPTAHVYYRVTPLGVAGGRSYIQVDYLSLWNRDDSLILGGACLSDIDLLDFLGIWSPQFGLGLFGHALDNERTIFRLVAPAPGGRINTKAGAYAVDRVFAAAHEDTASDRSQLYFINPPQGPEVHFAFFPSLSKHGTYGFWPHGVPLLPSWAIGAIFGGVAGACLVVDIDTCDFLWFIAYEVVYECITEKHAPGLGGVQPGAANRVNVGEADNPLPGASFILVPALQEKLGKVFVIP
jgi:PKD repeat protein